MFHPTLQSALETRLSEFALIDAERSALLDQFGAQLAQSDAVNQLVFICTHNSRRSHLTQVWAQIAAQHFGLNSVRTFSGGTEATRVYPSTLAALVADGFEHMPGEGDNPTHQLSYADDLAAMNLFSKVYDHPDNPNQDFIAFMTCDHAAENCPFIPNAHSGLNLTYIDPKYSDGQANEAAVYLNTSHLIAREMLYLFQQVSSS